MLVHYFQVNTRLFRVPFISTADSRVTLALATLRHYTTARHNRGRGTEGNDVAVSGIKINVLYCHFFDTDFPNLSLLQLVVITFCCIFMHLFLSFI